MIPKKLHYVWLGGAPIPQEYQRYIDGWRDMMPDWEIVRWDETNFDIEGSCDYCRQAYQAKRWAFVSDYVRVKVLYEHGGIYLDTDEEMIRPLDKFAMHDAFFGMEAGKLIGGQVFGCERGHKLMKVLMDDYDNRAFVCRGNQDTTVIGNHIARVLMGVYPQFRPTDKLHELESDVFVYPSEYFCPDMRGPVDGPNTYTIHHYAGTWLSSGQRLKMKFNDFIGQRNAKQLSRIKQWLKRRLNR